jgi:hypothetical protein
MICGCRDDRHVSFGGVTVRPRPFERKRAVTVEHPYGQPCVHLIRAGTGRLVCSVCMTAGHELHPHVMAFRLTGERHGASSTREYWIWAALKQRCSNPSNPSYRDYGARGVKILYESFEAFLADVGPRPGDRRFSIHRKDNSRDFEPGNCVWAPGRPRLGTVPRMNGRPS